MRLLAVSLTLLMATSRILLAQHEMPTIQGQPAPQVAVVREDGNLEVYALQHIYLEAPAPIQTDEEGEGETPPEVSPPMPQRHIRLLKLEPKFTRFYEIGRGEIDAAAAAARLRKPTLVVGWPHPGPLPGYYATVFQPGTLVVVAKVAPQIYGGHSGGAVVRPGEGIAPSDAPAPAAPPGDEEPTQPIEEAVPPDEDAVPEEEEPAPAEESAVAPEEVPPPGPANSAVPDDVKFPEGEPPRFEFARIDAKGQLHLRNVTQMLATKIVPGLTKGPDGNPTVREHRFRHRQENHMISSMDAKVATAQSAAGKPISTRELTTLLATERTVLTSGNGEPVDPEWLQWIRPEVIVITAPIPGHGGGYAAVGPVDAGPALVALDD